MNFWGTRISETMTKIEFLKQLGSTIAKERKRSKLTQSKVAELCDIERGNLTRIEKGRANITAETLFKLSGAIGCPVSKFFAFQKGQAVRPSDL